MKLNGFVGKGSGRLGSSVFAVRGGEQIVRQYTPNVANPNTEAQKAQRAKFKLLSQLAAITADGLLFPKVGNVSRRNAFVSANMPAVTYVGDVATLAVGSVKLGIGFEPITVKRTDNQSSNEVVLLVEGSGWDGFGFATVDFVEVGRILGVSGMIVGMEGPVPVIGARMSRTQIVVAAWRFRDGAARAKYGNIMSSSSSQANTNITLRMTELVANGDIIVSQTVVATAS